MSRVVIGCLVAVPCSHWSAVPTHLYDNISQLLRDSFSVFQQPPIWEPPSHCSMGSPLTSYNVQHVRVDSAVARRHQPARHHPARTQPPGDGQHVNIVPTCQHARSLSTWPPCTWARTSPTCCSTSGSPPPPWCTMSVSSWRMVTSSGQDKVNRKQEQVCLTLG